MDSASDQNNQQNPQSLSISAELEHVTQEMYKKNAELALTNKTLSILQKINTLILSSVTDLTQISQHLVDVIVSEAGFQSVNIYILKKDEGLAKLAGSGGEAAKRAEFLIKKPFPSEKISIENKDNFLIKVVKMPRLQITSNYLDILTPDFTSEEAKTIQDTLNVKTILVYPLVIREEVIGVISLGVVEDVSELSEYEQDLMNRLAEVIGIAIDNSLLYQKIQDANERLKDLDHLKDEFVSLASHELRTPMTAIKSYVWLLLNGKTGEISEKQREYLTRTYDSTERLIQLVNDMLNISRIESGRFTVQPTPVDISQLMKETIAEVDVRAQEFGIKLSLVKPEKPLMVNADSSRIKEVAINLIGNSLKFTPKDGSITVSVADGGDGFIYVKVHDTGRGIEKDDIPKLFRKFNMLGSNYLTKDRGQGTGLGLYLSKSLVELHGGKIWAESEGLDKGSTFTFTLPVLKENAGVTGDSQTGKDQPPVSNPQV